MNSSNVYIGFQLQYKLTKKSGLLLKRNKKVLALFKIINEYKGIDSNLISEAVNCSY